MVARYIEEILAVHVVREMSLDLDLWITHTYFRNKKITFVFMY